MNWLRFLVLVLSMAHCRPTHTQCRLLYRSLDLGIPSDQYAATSSDTANQITGVESRGAFSKYLILRYAHARRKLIRKDSIWGFIDSHQAIWRSYGKELFLVRKYTSGWVEYIIPRPVGARLNAIYGAVMYSRTLDSKIKATWMDAMSDVPPGFIMRSR